MQTPPTSSPIQPARRRTALLLVALNFIGLFPVAALSAGSLPDGSPPETITTDHWSFQAVKPQAVPSSGNRWAKGEIDEFILAKLTARGQDPSGQAEPRTLIRRLYLVMHGLPPSPEAVTAYLSDSSPEAWPRLVDRVLADSHYGERWGRHWLDVVRYADSNGFETNRLRRTAWPYRDYVIAAFNTDKPYDRFIREQLAGDALGVDAATGFLVAGPHDIVASPDRNLSLMQRQDDLADMVNTTGTAFLGLTMGCARCHTHKFDPIPHRDYFAMQAVFAGVSHGERAVRQPLDGGMAWVGTFSQPAETHRLNRGDPLQPREVVAPGALTVLGSPGMAADEPEQQRRLRLGAWIASRDNPLTARVMVNRLWHYIFGHGMVDTPSDLGVNGSRPTHPELLDWMAEEFVRSGWSVKHMQRLILLSSTFQQSSAPREEELQADAGSRLLWRFPPRRMEAEAIRDSILAVSGALNPEPGGPGFYLMEVEEENVMHYHPKENFTPQEFRRMVYQTRIRQTTDSVFGSFDCPDGSQVTPRRSQSNTPLQALNLFNSRFVLQQAEILAGRLRGEGAGNPESEVTRAFQLFYARPPDTFELTRSAALIREQGLEAFSRALFNSSEFLFVF